MGLPDRKEAPAQVVCLDFDDTLCAADGRPVEGARKAVVTLRARGFRAVVSSARFAPFYGELNVHRVRKVKRWLDEAGIEVDGITEIVPAAVAYVDDQGLRFAGDWQATLSELGLGESGGRAPRRVSFGLECLLEVTGPVAGAVDGLSTLRAHRVEVVVSAGPVVREGDLEASLNEVRSRLQEAGLGTIRVEAAKIASDAYVSERACRLQSTWQSAWKELEDLLD